MKKTLLIILTLTLSLAAFAQTAPQASPAPITADKPAAKAKEFKPDLTPEESALLNPIIADFNKWSAKLNAASEILDKSADASSPEVEALQIQLAAKDIRAARKELKRVQGDFAKWQAEVNKNHDCADCRFDESTGKLVRAPAPKP